MYKNAKQRNRETTERKCENCQKPFQAYLFRIKHAEKYGRKGGRFCSLECKDTWERKKLTTSINVFCAQCGKSFIRTPAQVADKRRKSNRQFCSRSCAAIYNNTHKMHGTRRSKLEAYLEERLRAEFPNLELICNSKDTIGSELDFYFPQLRLAIELNGIFHYEPIYGSDKLKQIQANDQQKSLHCTAAGIEFCTIDTSTVNNVTKSVKERYWSIVKNLVAPLLGRADSTNMQVS